MEHPLDKVAVATRATWLAAALAACTNPGAVETRPLGGDLVFLKPVAGDTLTQADDVDPAQPGIQLPVEVAALRLDATAQVTITVDTTAESLVVPTVGGVASVVMTFPGGAFPDGVVSNLMATAAGTTGAQSSVRVIANSGARCELVSPAPLARLGPMADLDVATPGLQAHVDVECVGDGVSPDELVILEVFALDRATGAPLQRHTQRRGAGVTRFEARTLPEGTLTLQMALARVGGATGTTRSNITVDLGRCDAHILTPEPGAVLTHANAQDLQPATAALDLDVTVASSLCPDGTARLTVNGSQTPPVPMVGGTTAVRAALPQGLVDLVANVTVSPGTRQPGDSVARRVRVDTLAPCATLTTPMPQDVLGVGQDEEDPPNPANGITWTLRGTVDALEPATTVTVTVRRGATPFFSQVLDASTGSFMVAVPDTPPGQYVATVATRDGLGNSCPQRGSAAQEIAFTVSNTGPGATLAVTSDTNADLAVAAAEDTDPATAGTQVDVTLRVEGTNPVGGSARVRFTPVDAAGNPVAGAVVEVLEVLTTAATLVRLTVPDGLWRLSAVVSFGDGRPNLTPQAVRVLVDTVAPDIRFLEPVDGAVLTNAVLQVALLTAASDVLEAWVTINGSQLLIDGVVQPGGLVLFAPTTIPNVPGPVALEAQLQDLVGNTASQTILVTLDPVGPLVTVRGVDRNGADRALEPTAAMGNQPRTLLDISSAPGLATLDQDQDAANGLQYAFSVEVPLAACANLGASPAATVRVTGRADAVAVPLQAAGAVCRGALGVGGEVTLSEGDGVVEAVVVDTAGRSGVAAGHYTVRRQAGFVRVDAPADGTRSNAPVLPVVASTNVTATGATCTLRVDGLPVESRPLTPVMAFAPVMLAAVDAGVIQLGITCQGGNLAQPIQSLPVTVIRDTLAPAPALLLANGDVMPAVFNAASPSDAPLGHPRFQRNVALEVPAESSACTLLADAVLRVTANPGVTATYAPRQSAAGSWTLLPGVGGGRCRAVFPRVDLGGGDEPGTVFTLDGEAVDTAGNRGVVVALPFLVDRQPPVVTITQPAGSTVDGALDVHPVVAGIQVVVAAQHTTDGRPTTAALTCVGPMATCQSQPLVSSNDTVTFGLDAQDPVTLSNGLEDTTTQLTVTVEDQAGNVGVAQRDVTVLIPRPRLTWRTPVADAVFRTVNGVGGVADVDAATPGIQAALEVDVEACGTPGNAGTASILGLGTPVSVTGDSTLRFDVTLPEGDAVMLSARCVDALGIPGASTISVKVDSVGPGPAVTLLAHNEAPANGTVVVRFHAPSDDANALAASSQYALAVAPAPVDNATFEAARWPGPAFVPHAPGTLEVLRLTGLPPGAHTLTLRVLDDAGNTLFASASVNVRGTQHSVTGATALGAPGDVDGDGAQDLLVVAPDRVEILHGDVSGTLSRRRVVVAGTFLHAQATAIPDLDGDGMDEVLVAGAVDSPRAYLWWGQAGGIPDMTPPDVIIEDGDQLGMSTRPHLGHSAAAVDLNRDGHRDLVVAAPALDDAVQAPVVFVVFGNSTRAALQTTPGTLDLAASVAAMGAMRLQGPPGSQMGRCVGAWEDATPALVVGAPRVTNGVMLDAGAAYVLRAPANAALGGFSFGLTTGAPMPLTLETVTGDSADQQLGLVVFGASVGGQANASLAVSSALGPVRIYQQDMTGLLGPWLYGPNGEAVLGGALLGDASVSLVARTGVYFGRPTPVDLPTSDLQAPAQAAADLNGDGSWELVRLDAQGVVHVVW